MQWVLGIHLSHTHTLTLTLMTSAEPNVPKAAVGFIISSYSTQKEFIANSTFRIYLLYTHVFSSFIASSRTTVAVLYIKCSVLSERERERERFRKIMPVARPRIYHLSNDTNNKVIQ